MTKNQKTKKRLTAAAIHGQNALPGQQQSFIYDTRTAGLVLRVSRTGKKALLWEGRVMADGKKVNRRVVLVKLPKTTSRTVAGGEADALRQCAMIESRLLEAREKADRFNLDSAKGENPFKLLEDERKQVEAEQARQEAEQEQARQEAEARRKFTLAALLRLYVAHLANQGKPKAAANAGSVFKVHVPAALGDLPAREITRPQLAEIIRRVREQGKERTAGVLRSYLHAAYELAMTAETDTAAPSDFIPFRVEQNPVRGVKPIPINPGQRFLNREELAEYLAHLGDRPADIALKVALLAGGQRMEQLLRATLADWDHETKTLLLLDSKGKRTIPRRHFLPLGPAAAALIDRQAEQARTNETNYLFFSPMGGKMYPTTPGKRLQEIAAAMGGQPFNLRDLRRTTETHLARIGISQDIRGQVLSHGLSGVQAKHYDRHTYEDEKREALEKWESYLETGLVPVADVVALADHRRAGK